MMKNWRYWDELIFKLPLHIVLGAKSIMKGLRPYHLIKADCGLPQGGVGDASKYDINIQFSDKYMLPFIKIEGKKDLETKIEETRIFIKEQKTKYPIVLKPDNGWAGKGVAIVQNEKEAKTFLHNTHEDYLVQEYCDYPEEYGVFYYKLKGKPNIYSINLKEAPSMVGDGKRSIKEIIIKEKKKRLLRYIDRKKFDIIPKKGERVELTKVYNIGQGGEYKDVSDLVTKELINAMEEAVGNTKFFYGRFDVKAKSQEELLKGHYKIIEVNGAHSSSSNYFDPKYGFLDAYKIIHKQYNLMLQIALEHKDERMDLLPYRQFMKRIRQSRKMLKQQQQKATSYR